MCSWILDKNQERFLQVYRYLILAKLRSIHLNQVGMMCTDRLISCVAYCHLILQLAQKLGVMLSLEERNYDVQFGNQVSPFG